MPTSLTTPRTGPRALVRSLAWLRLCAIAGQSAAVLVAVQVLGMPIAELYLFVGIGLLTVVAAIAGWRLQRPWAIGEWEAVGHVAVDSMVLSYLLYFTGG